MPTLTAEIPTDRAARFLRQFCQHAAAMGSERGHSARMHHGGSRADITLTAEHADGQGKVTFGPWGTCTLTAGPAALTVRIDAPDDAALERIRDIVTRDFDRFSARNPLRVDWRGRENAGSGRRSRLVVAAITLVAFTVVAVHLGLAGAALRSGWSLTALGLVALALAVKATLLVVASRRGHRLRLHHRRPPQPEEH